MIEKYIEKVENNIKENKQKIVSYLKSIVMDVYSEIMNKDKANDYCMTFQIPRDKVINLFKIFDIDANELKKAFEEDFGWPKNSNMYGNPYYHILLVLFTALVKLDMEREAKTVLFLIQLRMWNGIKYRFIKFCNKDVMNYVIEREVTRKHLVSKYESPLELLTDYFVQTIYKKYGEKTKDDLKYLKDVFNHSWKRLFQLFHNKLGTGLADLYYKVHAENKTISSSQLKQSDEELDVISTYESKTSKYISFINDVTSNIIASRKVKYKEDFINYVNRRTKVSRSAIMKIAEELHNPEYSKDISELLTLLITRVDIMEESIVCSDKFFPMLDSKIISSKNNYDISKIKEKSLELLDKIIKKVSNKSVHDYSVKISLIRVLIFILAYNIQYYACKK